jgi:3-oxoacyl-[acyl-carrier-protein] synthase-1
MTAGRPYPITAYSLCNALGLTTAEVAEALFAGRSGLGPPPIEVPFETVCGALPAAPPAALSRYDTRVFRMVLAALEGMEREVRRAVARRGAGRVAVVLGTSTGGIEHTEDAWFELRRTGRIPEGYDFLYRHPFHLVAEGLGELLGARGPRYVISTACSSSGKALASARRLLDAGLADAVVAGGVDGLCQTTLRGFHSLGILSPRACRPFGQGRDGISIGEGAALLLVERDGDGTSLLLGVGESADGYHMSAPDPEGRGARAAMLAAIAEAGLEPRDVDHVNAHGTGTPQNDAAEARAILEVLGDQVPVVSTKGYTGHLLAAGGATEAIFGILSLDRGLVPASLGAAPCDETVGMRIPLGCIEHACRTVLSNSFGFGGSNASVLLGRAP